MAPLLNPYSSPRRMVFLRPFGAVFFLSFAVYLTLTPILGTRYRTVLFPKLADAFLMIYKMVVIGIITNIGAFGEFCHGNPVSVERVQSGDFGTKKARKRPVFRHLRTFSQWQGQKDLNPRHAVLEAMLNFILHSDFTPILGICCQPRR